jgi:hypothetical protein
MGCSWGIAFGLVMSLVFRPTRHLSPTEVVLVYALASALFGVAMATYYRAKAVSLRLPPWDLDRESPGPP